MAAKTEKRSVYLPAKLVREMLGEAERQGRTLSWLIQESWLLARKELLSRPAVAPRDVEPVAAPVVRPSPPPSPPPPPPPRSPPPAARAEADADPLEAATRRAGLVP